MLHRVETVILLAQSFALFVLLFFTRSTDPIIIKAPMVVTTVATKVSIFAPLISRMMPPKRLEIIVVTVTIMVNSACPLTASPFAHHLVDEMYHSRQKETGRKKSVEQLCNIYHSHGSSNITHGNFDDKPTADTFSIS